jgi:hypothetical protein
LKRVAILTAPLILLAVACRFGGPSGDPSAYVPFGDASDDRSMQATAETQVDEAGAIDASSDATRERDAASDAIGATDGSERVDGADGATCAPPASIPVCNPVQNTGCFLLQCDVDTTQSVPTGRCVGGGIAAIGATCTVTSGSEACAAQTTCSGSMCRRLCFCDSDCAVGDCCTDVAGTSGFHLCAPCR